MARTTGKQQVALTASDGTKTRTVTTIPLDTAQAQRNAAEARRAGATGATVTPAK